MIWLKSILGIVLLTAGISVFLLDFVVVTATALGSQPGAEPLPWLNAVMVAAGSAGASLLGAYVLRKA